MTHNQPVPQNIYDEVLSEGYFLTKHKTTFAKGDKMILSLENTRDETEYSIKTIISEHVNRNNCILLLKPVNVNDLLNVDLSGAVQS